MLMYHGHLQLKITRKNMDWQFKFFDLAVCCSFLKSLLAVFITKCLDDK